MRADAVGHEVLGHRDEVRLGGGRAAGAGDAGLRVDDDVGDRAAARQRGQREQRRRRVAAGVGDEVGAGDLLAVDLGQAVDAGAEALGRAVLAVPALVGRPVAQAKVGGEVDDAHAALEQRVDDGRRRAVRVGDDRRVGVAVDVEVELLEDRVDAVMRDRGR